MEVKVYTNISKKYENIEICINAPEINEEVKKIENDLSLSFNKTIKEVLGVQGNDIYFLSISGFFLLVNYKLLRFFFCPNLFLIIFFNLSISSNNPITSLFLCLNGINFISK